MSNTCKSEGKTSPLPGLRCSEVVPILPTVPTPPKLRGPKLDPMLPKVPIGSIFDLIVVLNFELGLPGLGEASAAVMLLEQSFGWKSKIN